MEARCRIAWRRSGPRCRPKRLIRVQESGIAKGDEGAQDGEPYESYSGARRRGGLGERDVMSSLGPIRRARGNVIDGPRQGGRARQRGPQGSQGAGKRAAIIETAVVPAPPISARTHARFRKNLDEVDALVERGDIEALPAYEYAGFLSSSPRAIMKFRDLTLVALRAQTARGVGGGLTMLPVVAFVTVVRIASASGSARCREAEAATRAHALAMPWALRSIRAEAHQLPPPPPLFAEPEADQRGLLLDPRRRHAGQCRPDRARLTRSTAQRRRLRPPFFVSSHRHSGTPAVFPPGAIGGPRNVGRVTVVAGGFHLPPRPPAPRWHSVRPSCGVGPEVQKGCGPVPPTQLAPYTDFRRAIRLSQYSLRT